ncbi:auxin efflux carrier component 6-like isoform X1 [Neltuma alba]|uniref:auxin efflux carrier component 6-like isoform X1 n=1 Tax=Neltuma alba TaxID=207710 RepID=UPI0010A57A1E|nr:auxin efflux carrier component 6-like isoform X1 [Prosopis alba]
MITWGDFYKVMSAMVPLYFSMLVAYASVKWFNVFTSAQCSGINRFVAVFAVPVLSFHFISRNNPYQMDSQFLLADTLSKLSLLFSLSLWLLFFRSATLDWLITLFSLSSLPNTLVMGIPLLQAMYGHFTHSLMVQLVVLQSIVWYTLLLFLFEYRAATFLIRSKFPGPTAASIVKFEVDGDVISLDGRDVPLRTETETDSHGRIRVRIRRSTSSAPDSTLSSSVGLATPRLSNAEIFSANTPLHLLQSHHAGAAEDIRFGYPTGSPRVIDYATSSDACSLQATPRASNFNEYEMTMPRSPPLWTTSPASGGRNYQQLSPGMCQGGDGPGCREITVSEKEISFRDITDIPMLEEGGAKDSVGTNQKMPRALVMMRLILNVVGRKLLRNPNTYSSVLGLVWSLISFKWNIGMPSLVNSCVEIVSDAGLGMAMFSLGLFMALQPRIIACGAKRAAMGMALRFLLGPLVMAAASVAIGLRGPKLRAAIVQASLPQGIVPFVFAREYGVHPDILSTGVIFGMLISLPVTLLYYVFLGL